MSCADAVNNMRFHMRKNDSLMELLLCQISALCSSNIWQWWTLTLKRCSLPWMMHIFYNGSPLLHVTDDSLYIKAIFTVCLLLCVTVEQQSGVITELHNYSTIMAVALRGLIDGTFHSYRHSWVLVHYWDHTCKNCIIPSAVGVE